MICERETLHVSDDSGRIAMLEHRTYGTATDDNNTAASLTRYVYSNHLQSAALELDGAGNIISYEKYHPYGTTAYQANNAGINATAKRYRYTGKERDEESGLYYHGARYYIPWLCRWTAVDPMEAKFAGMSPYNYAFNNPVMWNDLSGASPGDPPNGWIKAGSMFDVFNEDGTNRYDYNVGYVDEQGNGDYKQYTAEEYWNKFGGNKEYRPAFLSKTPGDPKRYSSESSQITGQKPKGSTTTFASNTFTSDPISSPVPVDGGTPEYIPVEEVSGFDFLAYGEGGVSAFTLRAIQAFGNMFRKLSSKLSGDSTYLRSYYKDEDGVLTLVGEEVPTSGASIQQIVNDVDALGLVGGGPAGTMLSKASTIRPSTILHTAEEVNSSLKMTLPSWKKVTIDIEHIISGHTAGGYRAGYRKDLFPANASTENIEKMVRTAYKNVHTKLKTQGERILLQGNYSDMTIEMWFNKVTKTIETAYPKSR